IPYGFLVDIEIVVTDTAYNEWSQTADFTIQVVEHVGAVLKQVPVGSRAFQVHIKDVEFAADFVSEIVTQAKAETEIVVQAPVLVEINPLQSGSQIELPLRRYGSTGRSSESSCSQHQAQRRQVSFSHDLSFGVVFKKRGDYTAGNAPECSESGHFFDIDEKCDGFIQITREDVADSGRITYTK